MSETVHLVEATVENFCRLTFAQLNLDKAGNVVVLTGENEAGKSSLLNAIVAGLKGAKYIPTDPVHHGAQKSVIKETLSNGMTIERTIKPDGSHELKLRDADGGSPARPQEILDKLWSTFPDPIEFALADEKKQMRMIENLIGLDGDALERKKKAFEEDRKPFGRDHKALKARYDKMTYHAGIETVDVAGVMESLEKLQASCSVIEDRQIAYRKAGEELQEILNQIELLQARADTLAGQKIPAMSAWLAEKPLPTEEIEALKAQIKDADRINGLVRANEEFDVVGKEMTEKHNEYERLTRELGAIEALRKQALADSKLPIEGIEFGEEGLLYKGAPFSEQASSSALLMVSIDLCIAMNPQMKLMVVKHGAFLDDKRMAIVAKKAKDHDWMLIIERPGTEAGAHVVIVAGEVAK